MVGETVNIIASPALSALKLKELVGKQGTIVEIGCHKHGAYVRLEKPYLNELEWFIPNESLQIV